MAGPKADKPTTERRIEAVYRLILDGWTVEQIRVNTQNWGITPGQLGRYIAAANARIEAAAAPVRAEHHRRAVSSHYQMLREAKTIKEKLAVWAALSRLLGLDAPKAVELSGKDGEPIPFRMVDYRAGFTETER